MYPTKRDWLIIGHTGTQQDLLIHSKKSDNRTGLVQMNLMLLCWWLQEEEEHGPYGLQNIDKFFKEKDN